jgi:hypothetical protein
MKEKMSTLSTSKILVCIYTCAQDAESVAELKDTDWFKDVSSRDNFEIIEVLADPSIKEEYSFKNNILTLKTEESYDNLCMKTYNMIDACSKLFDFDHLLKIDSNIIKNRHNKTSMLFSFEYFLKKFYNEGVFGEYNGLTPIQGNTVEQFRNWASSKKLFVMPEVLISEIGESKWATNYWAGGCYCLGQKSIQKVIAQKKLFQKFKNLMGGCEDMAVASALIG